LSSLQKYITGRSRTDTHTHTHIHTYIHTHAYTHIYTHTSTHTHTHTNIYTHTYTHTHTHIHIHAHIHTHIHTHTHTHIHIHTHIHTYIHTHTHICTYTHTHIYIYTHTHTYIYIYIYIYKVIGFIGGAVDICDTAPFPQLICSDISTQSKITIKNCSSSNLSTTANKTTMLPRAFGPKSPSAICNKNGDLTFVHSTSTTLSSVKFTSIFFTCLRLDLPKQSSLKIFRSNVVHISSLSHACYFFLLLIIKIIFGEVFKCSQMNCF